MKKIQLMDDKCETQQRKTLPCPTISCLTTWPHGAYMTGSIQSWSRSYLTYVQRGCRLKSASSLRSLSQLLLNLTLPYTRGFTPKCVPSGGDHLHCLAPGQRSAEKEKQR